MKILFIGDIVGEPGRKALKKSMPGVVDKLKVDFVIANAENAAGGFGITSGVGEELFSLGIDVLTSGNHIWDKKEAVTYISKESRLLRPANYSSEVPGFGNIVMSTPSGEKIGVLNVCGRVFMSQSGCPFKTAKKEITKLKEQTNVIIVDFHAEATSEKLAFGWFLDGEVSAVIGTHTHVQTADERVLPKGTAYITDVGMTGPMNSVIGIKKEQIIDRFLKHMPVRFEVARGDTQVSAVVVDIDQGSGKATDIQRLNIRSP